MELTRNPKTTVLTCGGQPYMSGNKLVKSWLETTANKLNNPNHEKLQKAMKVDSKLEEMLKVFNVDNKGYPVIKAHMLFRCSLNAAKLVDTWNKYKVSAERWKSLVRFTPEDCSLFNGKQLKTADGVMTVPISPKGKPSFFASYQTVNEGTTFTFKIIVSDSLCQKASGKGKEKIMDADLPQTKKCVNEVLDMMCLVGVGAYRDKYGKFKYV